MDVWGRIYRDHWERDPHPHRIERDDGKLHEIESAAAYFEAPRLAIEEEELRRLGGPVLDVGGGPGSYAIYLQNHGLTVTTIDSSRLAMKIAGQRGCLDARVMDLRDLDFDAASFESIVVMGNTFGVHQGPDTLGPHMAKLRWLTRDRGTLVTATVDPLDTEDPDHLLYHERNRERGHPPGLVRARVLYREDETDWMDLWLTTREEVEPIAEAAGWRLAREASEGPWRVRRFVAA